MNDWIVLAEAQHRHERALFDAFLAEDEEKMAAAAIDLNTAQQASRLALKRIQRTL